MNKQKNIYKTTFYKKLVVLSSVLESSVWRLSLILTLGFLLTACSNLIPSCSGSRTSPPSSELVNTQWELIRWNLAPNQFVEVRARNLGPETNLTKIQMQFDSAGKRLSGFAGCNRFSAEIIEDSRGMTLDKIAATRMACSEQSMQFENDFLYQLRDYRTMVRDGDRLLLIGQDREVLSFSQRIKAGTP